MLDFEIEYLRVKNSFKTYYNVLHDPFSKHWSCFFDCFFSLSCITVFNDKVYIKKFVGPKSEWSDAHKFRSYSIDWDEFQSSNKSHENAFGEQWRLD